MAATHGREGELLALALSVLTTTPMSVVQECNTQRCPQYVIVPGAWSACGTQGCMQVLHLPYATLYHTSTLDFGVLRLQSGTCQTRDLVCRDVSQSPAPAVALSLCDRGTPSGDGNSTGGDPSQTTRVQRVSCTALAALQYEWRYTDWTDCTKPCGTGLQQRNASCVLKGEILPSVSLFDCVTCLGDGAVCRHRGGG